MNDFLIEYGKCRKNLIVKGVQGLDIHLQSQGIPVNCYYMVVGKLLDSED